MLETKKIQEKDDNLVVERAKNFWVRYNRPLIMASAAIIILCGSYLGYKYLVKLPKEQKAADVLFKAEEYYRMDSLNLALNGDGMNWGFLKVINNYGGTEAGNLARYYAGYILLKQAKFGQAEKYLKEFSTDSKPVQAKAYKLLGDVYAEENKNADALTNYKKAAAHFKEDELNSSEYLFMAAYFAQNVVKNKDEAVSLFKELKEKYPRTSRGSIAEKYLAQLGVYN